MRTLRRDNKSMVTGVSYYKRRERWRAEIRKDGKFIFLGFHHYRKDAIKARLEKEYELFGLDAPQAKLFPEFGIGE